MRDGWKGTGGAFGAIAPGMSGGGGLAPARLQAGRVLAIWAGQGGGGGRVPSSAEPLTGFGGCGGPGPGALIGLSGGRASDT